MTEPQTFVEDLTQETFLERVGTSWSGISDIFNNSKEEMPEYVRELDDAYLLALKQEESLERQLKVVKEQIAEYKAAFGHVSGKYNFEDFMFTKNGEVIMISEKPFKRESCPIALNLP